MRAPRERYSGNRKKQASATIHGSHSIQRTRGRVFGCPYPGGAELLGMAAMSLGTGEDKDFAAPMARHLNGKMSAGPKSEQSQALTGVHIGQAQGAKAHNAGAQQGRGFLAADRFRDG